MHIDTNITLNNSVLIPQLGLGVFRAGAGRATEDAVTWAIESGYRHFDTAAIYRNEPEVGTALRQLFDRGVIRRGEVFVTTKLWNDDHGFDPALRAFDASLERLGLGYIDLFLLHWSVA